MHRSVEPHISFFPGCNVAMEGMHSAGMQPCRGFFVGLSLRGTKQSGTLHGRRTLHTANAETRTLRAAPDGSGYAGKGFNNKETVKPYQTNHINQMNHRSDEYKS
jgi:hypothetical protein